MRTLEQINSIKAKVSDPYAIENFLSVDEVDYLVKLFDSQEIESNKVYKNTGPITLDIKPYLGDPVVAKIIDKLVKELGPFEMTAGFFFTTNYPHIIHNDDTFELPAGVYKGITIPLKVYGSERIPKLCFFDQFYFHGPAKFFKGSKDIPTYYNKQVYDYQDVDSLSSDPFVGEYKYFTHLYPQWLEGLSFHSALDWIPGNALIFDSTRLHCASDFRSLGIKSKLAISIFTKIVD
jgi:hypothetical protein